MAGMKPVNVALPAALHKKLLAIKEKTDVPITAIIRKAVTAYIAKHGRA